MIREADFDGDGKVNYEGKVPTLSNRSSRPNCSTAYKIYSPTKFSLGKSWLHLWLCVLLVPCRVFKNVDREVTNLPGWEERAHSSLVRSIRRCYYSTSDLLFHYATVWPCKSSLSITMMQGVMKCTYKSKRRPVVQTSTAHVLKKKCTSWQSDTRTRNFRRRGVDSTFSKFISQLCAVYRMHMHCTTVVFNICLAVAQLR